MANERAKRRHLLNILTMEHQLRDLALATYKDWLPAAHAAVIPEAFTAASVFDEPLPPNPDGILSTQKDWENSLDKVFIHGLGQIMGRQVVAYIGATGAVPAAEEFRNAYLNDVRNRMVKTPDSVWGEISRDLAEGIDKGETPEQLRDRVQRHLDANDLNTYKNRADNVARTEAAGAYNGARYQAALLEAAAYGDVLDAVWLSTIDGKTRRSHVAADGQRVRIGTPFRVGGHELRWPGDPRGPANEVCRCRCAVSFLDAEDDLPEENDRHTERGPGATTVKNRNGLTQDEQIQLWRDQGILRARDDPDGIGRDDGKPAASTLQNQGRAGATGVNDDDTPQPAIKSGSVPVPPGSAVAELFDGVVPDLSDRRQHILHGDKDGGGHLYGTNVPKKTEFPRSWDEDAVMAAVLQTLLSPNSYINRMSSYTLVYARINGVRMVVRLSNDRPPRVITAHPLDGDGVVRNDKKDGTVKNALALGAVPIPEVPLWSDNI